MLSEATTTGEIKSGTLYTTREVRGRLGLGEKSWKELREAGLEVVRHGKGSFVFGDDILAVFKKLGVEK